MVVKYEEFMHELVEGIFDDGKLLEYGRELLSYVEKTNNEFTSYLKDVNNIIRKYKLNSDFRSLIARTRDHLLHDRELRKVLEIHRRDQKNTEETEIYLALTFAHIISHNNASSVKLPEKAVEETVEAVNNYLKSKGLASLKIKHLENNEPSEIFKIVMQKTYKFLSPKYQLC